MRSAEATTLPPMNRAIDLMVCTSKAAQEFPEYSGERQSKLLWLVLKEASWKAGELRMSLQEPFQKLRLSNSGKALSTDGKTGSIKANRLSCGVLSRSFDRLLSARGSIILT